MRDLNDLVLPDNLPKTAVIGAGGFIGSAFMSAYRRKYPDCTGTSRRRGMEGLSFLDLSAPDIKPLCLSGTGHKEALILAAVTNIDLCETEKAQTRGTNVTGTLAVIRQLSSEGIKPIYFSSDYVFSGDRGRYSDDDRISPSTEYGRQKAEVEEMIPEICGEEYLIVRLSKIFTVNKGSGTLLDEMASILAGGGDVRAAYDQIFCPTLVWDVVNAVARLQAIGAKGIWNVCSPEVWLRYDVAAALAKKMNISPERVLKISIDDLDLKARRPKNISMVPKKLFAVKGIDFTPMSECINIVAKNWMV